MTFIEPTWFEGFAFYALWIFVPIVIAVILIGIGFISDRTGVFLGGVVVLLVGIVMFAGGASVMWHYQYEVPSVQQEVITVDDWQPYFGLYWGEITSADDLMLQTKDGRLFENKENFLFSKFETRDVLNQLRPNGTYKITYYGWREGFNNGVPNILSVDEVINENGTPSHHDIGNYMNKRSIILSGDDDYDDWRQ